MLVQFGSGGGDGGGNALLPRGKVGRRPGEQPRPAAAEQADPVETEGDRLAGVEPAQRGGHAGKVPATQHRVRQVRHMTAVSMRAQARHAERLQLVPQRADRPLASAVEQQAHRQRHRDHPAHGVRRAAADAARTQGQAMCPA